MASSLTPPPAELAVKKKGRKAYGFKEYGVNEVHPSKTFNAALEKLAPGSKRSASLPLDFMPGDLPRVIPCGVPHTTGDIVATLHHDGVPEMTVRSWLDAVPLPLAASRHYSIIVTTTSSSSTSSPEFGAVDCSDLDDGAASYTINDTRESVLSSDDEEALSTQSAPDRGEQVAFKTDSQKQFEAAVRAMGPNVRLGFPTSEKGQTSLKRAQMIYSAQARLLVGNLPAEIPNGILSITIQHEFGVFGKCFAAVFRGQGSGVHRPYAIVQFVRVCDAYHAFYEADGMDIWGRPARVERSNRRAY